MALFAKINLSKSFRRLIHQTTYQIQLFDCFRLAWSRLLFGQIQKEAIDRVKYTNSQRQAFLFKVQNMSQIKILIDQQLIQIMFYFVGIYFSSKMLLIFFVNKQKAINFFIEQQMDIHIDFLKQVLKSYLYLTCTITKMQKPDPRFEKYEEIFDKSEQVIGFKLPENDHIFYFEQDGGWYDEKGNYYNHEGILQQEARQQDEIHGDDQEDLGSDQQQILGQFERMLAEQEQGIIRKKPSLEKQHIPKEQSIEKIDNLKECQQLIEKYSKGQNLRQGLPKQLTIFFKIKAQFCTLVVPQVEQKKSVQEQNKKVKQINEVVVEQRQKLMASNPWLKQQQVQFDFSGNSHEKVKQKQGSLQYRRYWYGKVRTSPQKFVEIWKSIHNSQQFSLLEHKTHFALKSRFCEKDKMKQFIVKMKQTAAKYQQNQLIQIILGNLPEQFPISFILDLLDLCGVAYQEIIRIKIIDQFRASVMLTKAGAIAITNLEGYCHDFKQYIEIEMKSLRKQISDKKGWFNVKINSEYKINYAQLFDCMAIEQSKTGLLKQNQKGSNYRWIIHTNFLKRISMFRGSTVDIEQLKQVCTQKDIV